MSIANDVQVLTIESVSGGPVLPLPIIWTTTENVLFPLTLEAKF